MATGTAAGDPMAVPFTDLGAMAEEVWPRISADFMSAMLAGQYIGGPAVAAFEQEWAAYCGTTHTVGVGNGTDSLQLTLEALGIGAGAEVVLPGNTFIATAEAVVRAGATPRFADVSPDTLLITPQSLRAVLNERTRAVVPVHLYGQMPDMEAICAVAAEAGIAVVEDAAQAHGATWAGRPAGSFGVAASFSFYPGKNVGAFGDAGAVVTSDPALAQRIRALANHGRHGGGAHYDHDLLGTNSRLDALQAIVLSGKLALNEAWTEQRIARAGEYRRRLTGTSIGLVEVHPSARHVYHLFVVRIADRADVAEQLRERGIATGIHYPTPCHLQPPLRRYAVESLPVTERSGEELLSLPIFPHMSADQVDRVCAALVEVYADRPLVTAAVPAGSAAHRG